MFPRLSYTRSEMAAMTGLSDDVLAHWIKSGLVGGESVGRGKGRHRTFSARDINKVAILARLRSFHCSIDMLRYVSSLINRAYEITDRHPSVNPYYFFVPAGYFSLYREFKNGGPALVRDYDGGIFKCTPATSIKDIFRLDERDFLDDEMQEFYNIVEQYYESDFDRDALIVASCLCHQGIFKEFSRVIWVLWPKGDVWHLYSDSDENLSGIREWPEAAIILSVSRILRSIWTEEMQEGHWR